MRCCRAAAFLWPSRRSQSHVCGSAPSRRLSRIDEFGNGGDDNLLLPSGELPVDGKREAFGGRAFSRRKVASVVTQIAEARLKVKRHWVVDLRANATLAQVGSKLVAACRADDELIE